MESIFLILGIIALALVAVLAVVFFFGIIIQAIIMLLPALLCIAAAVVVFGLIGAVIYGLWWVARAAHGFIVLLREWGNE